MSALYDAARAAHPELSVTAQEFEAAWKKRGAAEEKVAGDVLLAAGIEKKDRAALEWLLARVKKAVAGMGARLPEHLRADVEGAVVDLVVMGSGEHPPRIGDYQGRGPLAGWLQVIVVRQAQQRSHAQSRRASDEEIERAVLSDLEAPSAPPELVALRSRFKGLLGPALRAAAEKLGPRERALISMHYVDGVTLDDLARAWQVHRATVARWLASARQSFLEATRDELAKSANLPRLDVDSVVRSLQSQVDLSLKRVLGG